MINKNREMYQKGYADGAIRFSYIPDFATEQEKSNWCAEYKDGKNDTVDLK